MRFQQRNGYKAVGPNQVTTVSSKHSKDASTAGLRQLPKTFETLNSPHSGDRPNPTNHKNIQRKTDRILVLVASLYGEFPGLHKARATTSD